MARPVVNYVFMTLMTFNITVSNGVPGCICQCWRTHVLDRISAFQGAFQFQGSTDRPTDWCIKWMWPPSGTAVHKGH